METSGHAYSPSIRAAVTALILVLGALAVLSCKQAPVEPVGYSKRQPIPMGPYTISVTHLETGDFSALSGMGVGQGTKGIAVYMTVKSEKSIEQNELESLGKRRIEFSIKDSTGKSYSTNLVIPADSFRMTKSAGQVRDFKGLERMTMDSQRFRYGLSQGEIDMVAIFGVPFSTRGYTLLIENSRPRSGQPRIAAVPLGR